MKWGILFMMMMGWLGDASADSLNLPQFTLKDPVGTAHCSTEIGKFGLVLVVTAPILSNENFQKGWNYFLPALKPKIPARLFFLEDMSSSLFKDMALAEIRRDYEPDVDPIVLIDDTGAVRRALGVAEKKTVVLVYNANGQLVHTESGKPSASSAKKIWMALQNG